MRIELTELGDGQFVEIRDPKTLSWGAQKAITATLKDNSIDAQLDVAEAISIRLIKSGHVLDELGAPLMFPLTVDSIGNAPATLIETVAKEFATARTAATAKN
jgi:hypothetical protein